MCLTVYLASDSVLPLVADDENAPGFHVRLLEEPEVAAVQGHFSKRYLYYLGSHSGCGCGFAYQSTHEGFHQTNADDVQKSLSRCVEYIAMHTSEPIEMLLCTPGAHAFPRIRSGITPEALLNDGLPTRDIPALITYTATD